MANSNFSFDPLPSFDRADNRAQRVVLAPGLLRSAVDRDLQRQRPRPRCGIVAPDEFADALATEHDRRRRGGRNGVVAAVSLFEIASVRHRLGASYVFDLISELTALVQLKLGALDLVNISEDGEILILARETAADDAAEQLDVVASAISAQRFEAGAEHILLTPSTGYATLDDGEQPGEVLANAITARQAGALHLDLRPYRWTPEMSPARPTDEQPERPLRDRLRLPAQIAATYALGLLLPIALYAGLDAVGVDITGAVYVAVCVALVVTGVMILVESTMASRQSRPPPPATPYPRASAIICAYLPNEAGTILDTVDAFLADPYPGGLQIIVAYNTPRPLPVERELRELERMHDRLHVVEVDGSNSKAQNVNAVLHLATGTFTAMFDADHEPRPGSFERAWAWLSNGYDVVQGHCLTRNGDASRLARMVAVEFESIYAVSHPGRARLHGFGVFGGSNGYWRTELLHETRMRGSMLTEDIDSSMRVIERGFQIRSDRNIVSRELGTTTFRQVWNQRLRWAQGWFQVTLQHSRRVWQSPHLHFRQRVGMTYLLGWRELYPWLSLQVFPLITYWLLRGDELVLLQPIFVLATLFVLHIGPAQTAFAYALADPEIRQHRRWFVGYLFFSTFFYTEFKNVISRVAHIKEALGERSWRVTPRSEDPVGLEPLGAGVNQD
ncbi:MAG: glycosyltransferase family 2 protein [Actinomycetota bacterium]